MSPLITVVMPVYNVGTYIDRCFESLQNQSYSDFEVIIVDDCGKDDSIMKAMVRAKKDPRFRIVHHERNLGTYHARHLGVKNARGEYIVFLDPDDELNLQFLELLYLHIKQKPTDMIFFSMETIPRKRFYQSEKIMLPVRGKSRVLSSVFNKSYNKIVWAGTSGKAYKKSLLEKAFTKLNIDENFRYVYTEDKLLYYTVLLENPSFSSLNFKGYRYHINNSSISQNVNHSSRKFLIKQIQFTTDKLKDLVANTDISEEEKCFFDFLLNNSVSHQVNMMKRFENSSQNYLNCVWTAYKAVPNTKLLVRILIYIFTLKSIKL